LHLIARSETVDQYYRLPQQTNIATMAGWTRQSLHQAIRASGLLVDKPVCHSTVPNTLPRSALDLHRVFGFRRISDVKTLPGFRANYSFMRSNYYQAIYRKIFNTLAFYDWTSLAQIYEQIPETKLPKDGSVPDRSLLEFVARNDFGIKWKNICYKSSAIVCRMIEAEALKRRALILAKEARGDFTALAEVKKKHREEVPLTPPRVLADD